MEADLSSEYQVPELWFQLLVQPKNPFLGYSFPHVHEGVEVIQVAVDGDDPSSNFSPVFYSCSLDVAIFPHEQVCDPGRRVFLFIAGFISEQHKIFELRGYSLFFPKK